MKFPFISQHTGPASSPRKQYWNGSKFMTLTAIFGMLSTALVFQNCGEVDPVSMGMSSYLDQYSKCKPPDQFTKTTIFAANDKVKIPDRWIRANGKVPATDPSAGSAQVLSTTPADDLIVPKGSQFTLVADEKCAKDHQSTQKSNSTKALTLAISSAELDPHVGGLGTLAHVMEIPEDMSVKDLKKMANNDECIVGMNPTVWREKNYAITDNRYPQQQVFPAIQASEGWDIFYGAGGISRDVVIAIIDDGTDFGHVDLAGVNAGFEKNFVSGESSAAHQIPPGASETDGHGTHVACLAGGHINGSALVGVMGLRQKIMGLNVFGASNGASDAAIRNAMVHAADNGAHVINMSLGNQPGSPESYTEREGVEYALSKGVVLAIAAGNSNNNNDTADVWPANFARGRPGVISVASTVAEVKSKSGFSNYGTGSVKIGAPGSSNAHSSQGVLSCFPRDSSGNSRMAYMPGTSMASPVVAGALAATVGLWWSRTGQRPTPAQVESVLLDSAEKLGELTPYVQNGNYLNMQRLAQLIVQRTGTNPVPSPSPVVLPSPSPVVRPSPSPSAQPSVPPGVSPVPQPSPVASISPINPAFPCPQ